LHWRNTKPSGVVDIFFLEFVVIAHDVPLGKHPLMQNARNQNSASFLTVKYNVPFALHSAQASPNVVAASTQ
jgi:hypothetical protein